MKKTNLHVLSRVSQKPSEGDGVSYGTQVNKHDRRQRLDVDSVVKIACEKREFPLDVQNETPTKPMRDRDCVFLLKNVCSGNLIYVC